MAEIAHEVLGVDADPEKVPAPQAGRAPFCEPGWPAVACGPAPRSAGHRRAAGGQRSAGPPARPVRPPAGRDGMRAAWPSRLFAWGPHRQGRAGRVVRADCSSAIGPRSADAGHATGSRDTA
ncbi:hypothetical protein [Streptomyces sp. NPDC090021]|uniref:hypothetical protein n=1 Tax=Streptomyces sp. NPDC090021 TaxID=3365919 RepID=UPI0038183AA3